MVVVVLLMLLMMIAVIISMYETKRNNSWQQSRVHKRRMLSCLIRRAHAPQQLLK
jgi:hypothetical protein